MSRGNMEPEITEYELTADEQGMLAGPLAQIDALQAEMQPIVRAIMRVRKLTGDGWSLNGAKLTRPTTA